MLDSKKIADLAHTFNLPMTAHSTGSLICVMATAHWAASVRDFIAAESVLGKEDWKDNIVLRDGPLYKDRYHALPTSRALNSIGKLSKLTWRSERSGGDEGD